MKSRLACLTPKKKKLHATIPIYMSVDMYANFVCIYTYLDFYLPVHIHIYAYVQESIKRYLNPAGSLSPFCLPPI